MLRNLAVCVSMFTMSTKSKARTAEQLIRDTGARVTVPRVAVLATLIAAERALTHQELESRIDRSRAVDRVTIYRVLEWLMKHGLAHKITGEDRVWRFNAAAHMHVGSHAHFKCGDCGQVLCLDPVAAKPQVRLPAGYRQNEVELLVKGWCADCVPAHGRSRGHARHQH